MSAIPDAVARWRARPPAQTERRPQVMMSSPHHHDPAKWEPIVCRCGEEFTSLGAWSIHVNPQDLEVPRCTPRRD